MRIIAGLYGSRLLQAPDGLATRPTGDRLRETLFSVLASRVEGANFLDLYAGSGAVGLEALSRGAARVTFVERARPALEALRGNLARLGVRDGFRIHAGNVDTFLRGMLRGQNRGVGRGTNRGPVSDFVPDLDPNLGGELERSLDPDAGFDLVFLDPPYDAASEYAATLGLLGGAAAGLVAKGALVVAEHRRKAQPDAHLDTSYGRLERTRLLQQGDAALSFYTPT